MYIVSRSSCVGNIYIDCRNTHGVTQNVLNTSCKQTFTTALNPVSRFAIQSSYLSFRLISLNQLTDTLYSYQFIGHTDQTIGRTTEKQGFDSWQNKKPFSPPKCPDRLYGPLCLLSRGHVVHPLE